MADRLPTHAADGKKIHTDLGVQCAGLRELADLSPVYGVSALAYPGHLIRAEADG